MADQELFIGLYSPPSEKPQNYKFTRSRYPKPQRYNCVYCPDNAIVGSVSCKKCHDERVQEANKTQRYFKKCWICLSRPVEVEKNQCSTCHSAVQKFLKKVPTNPLIWVNLKFQVPQ